MGTGPAMTAHDESARARRVRGLRRLTTAAQLKTRLYGVTGDNADNITNFRDIPLDLVQ